MSDQSNDIPVEEPVLDEPAAEAPAEPVDADVAAAEDENAEVQAKADDAEAKGYFGHVPDENPNDAYSITTGPDAPELSPDDRTRADQPAAPKEAS